MEGGVLEDEELNYCMDLLTKQKTNGETFAEKLKSNPDYQVGICTEPARVFKEEETLEFLDAVGNALFQLPEESAIPTFLSTVRRDHYIIVTATDEYSRNWLLNSTTGLSIWEGSKINAIPAKEIPKLEKGLLWFPGKQKLENEELLRRMKRQNPVIKNLQWKIFSRHEEPHGTRLFIGIDQESYKHVKSIGNQLYWSTSRAQFTPLDTLTSRKRDHKIKKRQQTSGDQRKKMDRGQPPKEPQKTHGGTIEPVTISGRREGDHHNMGVTPTTTKSSKRKPEESPSVTVTDTATRKQCSNNDTPQNEDPFTPTRALKRSPPRSIKKKKVTEEKGEKDKGKITQFLRREERSSPEPQHNQPILKVHVAASSPQPEGEAGAGTVDCTND